jgi:hypothetical protein
MVQRMEEVRVIGGNGIAGDRHGSYPTVCLRGRHALLHRDRDFAPFVQRLGLVVVHP